MKRLPLVIRAGIKIHVRRMLYICVGFVTVAGAIDAVRSSDNGTKTFGQYEESHASRNNDRDQDNIHAQSDAVVRIRAKRAMIREVSAYNSLPGQTDSTPCISADGTDICKRHKKGECIVASNAYPLNTRLRIETIGDCIVADRTHPRFGHRVDVFMNKDIRGAREFGVQKLTIAELRDEEL